MYIGDKDDEEVASQARRAWRDMGPLEPTVPLVHESFYVDFAADPSWHVTIAIERAVFTGIPHMRAVIMHLRKSDRRDFQAIAIAH